jgi:hypothetical protein
VFLLSPLLVVLFIGVIGTSTDLERSVWCQVVAGQSTHVVG